MSITREFTGRPQRAINNSLGEGGVNLVSAHGLVMNKTELLHHWLIWNSEPDPNAHVHAFFNLDNSSYKGIPNGAPASCSSELDR